MRAGDRAEALSVGKDPRAFLRASCRHSLYAPEAAFADGAIAAMWGMGGDVLSDIGEPWLVTAAPVERVKFAMLRVGRAAIASMLGRRRRLQGFVAADYRGAVWLLEHFGFTVEAPQPVGPKRALFRKFWIEAKPPPDP